MNMNMNIALSYPALSVECYFSLSNGPRRTSGTLKGVAEEKIALQQQEASRVLSSAHKQTGWGG